MINEGRRNENISIGATMYASAAAATKKFYFIKTTIIIKRKKEKNYLNSFDM